jgi:predicted acetyltransferase
MPNEITLRTPTADEFPRFVAPLSIAFSEELSEAAIENDRQTIELDRFFGALDGEDVVGCGGAYSFRLTVPGGEVGAAGITGVGVLPTHRRRGILRSMMRRMFDQARERAEPVAILWASEGAIYQRFGYGFGTLQTDFEALKDKVVFSRPVDPPGQMRIVGLEEALRRLPPVYDAMRRWTPGFVARSEARWRHETLADAEWMRHGNGHKVLALLEVNGEVRGFVIFRTRSDWDSSGPKDAIWVMELLGLDPVAEQYLWQWIFSIDLVGTVRGSRGPVPHPLQMLVTEPRRLNARINDGTWLRIIDLPAALGGRSYGLPGSLVLDVSDEFCPWNAGRWQLTVPGRDGRPASVEPAPASARADLSADIRDLASVYLGALRFGDLARVGRVRERRPGAVALADQLFARSVAPWNATMF